MRSYKVVSHLIKGRESCLRESVRLDDFFANDLLEDIFQFSSAFMGYCSSLLILSLVDRHSELVAAQDTIV